MLFAGKDVYYAGMSVFGLDLRYYFEVFLMHVADRCFGKSENVLILMLGNVRKFSMCDHLLREITAMFKAMSTRALPLQTEAFSM